MLQSSCHCCTSSLLYSTPLHTHSRVHWGDQSTCNSCILVSKLLIQGHSMMAVHQSSAYHYCISPILSCLVTVDSPTACLLYNYKFNTCTYAWQYMCWNFAEANCASFHVEWLFHFGVFCCACECTWLCDAILLMCLWCAILHITWYHDVLNELLYYLLLTHCSCIGYPTPV